MFDNLRHTSQNKNIQNKLTNKQSNKNKQKKSFINSQNSMWCVVTLNLFEEKKYKIF